MEQNCYRIANRLKYLLVALLAVSVYINAIGHSFVFDDQLFIIKNRFIQDDNAIFNIFTDKFLKHTWEDLDVNRPVMVISLILDFTVWKLNPMGYHLTNLIIHSANTAVLLFLLSLIFSDDRIPIISAAIFAVHPVHIQAVNAINFREDLLVTFFYMLSLICFIKAAKSGKGDGLFLFSQFFYIFALLSKEMALTVPVISLLYLWGLKQEKPPRWVFSGYLIVTIFYILFFLYIRQFSGGMVFNEKTLLERVYGAFVISGRYLWLHLFPIGLMADYDVKPFFSFTLRNVVSMVLVVGLIVWTFYKFITKSDQSFFFLGWFLITLIPVTNIIPILNPVAERYLYLPSIGIITLVVIVMNSLLTRNKSVLLLSAVILFFSILTLIGNTVWKNEYLLWNDILKKAPGNANAHYRMGLIYAKKRQPAKAYEEFQAALKSAPENPFFTAAIHNSMGQLYADRRQFPKAYEEFQTAIALSPHLYEAHINLGSLYMKDFQYDKAHREYEIALKSNPDSDIINYKLGLLYIETKQHDKAYLAYQNALKLNPRNAEVYFSLGALLFEDSNIERSISMIRKGIYISPTDPWAHSFLGDLYMKTGNRELAVKEYNEAMRLGQGVSGR